MGKGASWAGAELRAITASLKAVREGLSGLAGELQVVESPPDDAQGIQTVREVQQRIGALTANLVGTLGRLEVLAFDLRRPAATGDPNESTAAAAELLCGTIQCVIADRLDPAIEALLDLQRPEVPGVTPG